MVEDALSKAEALLNLQAIDRVIDQLNKRLSEVQFGLNESAQLKAARQAAQTAEQLIVQTRSAHADLETENTALTAHLAENDKRLYSGEVTAPKELIDLQNDVAMLKKQKAALDDKVLAAMTKADEAEAALKDRQSELEKIETEWAAGQVDLLAEQEKLNGEIAAQKAETTTFRAELSASDLTLYDQLRRRKGGVAVAELDGEACAACGVEPTADVIRQLNRGDQTARCSNCERILVQV
jgi:predicted  nucleic acid-binding Zn-ribbon protein